METARRAAMGADRATLKRRGVGCVRTSPPITGGRIDRLSQRRRL
jgi:hypothetical protein